MAVIECLSYVVGGMCIVVCVGLFLLEIHSLLFGQTVGYIAIFVLTFLFVFWLSDLSGWFVEHLHKACNDRLYSQQILLNKSKLV